MLIAPFVLGLVLTALVGCAGAPELRDSFRTSDFRLPRDERLRIEAGAPIIVLGRVLEVDAVGRPHGSPGDSRVRTQLSKLKILVEEAIRGSVASNTLEFYYFTYSVDNTVDLGVRWYIPNVGQRRVYFLKPWGSTYRSVGDVTDYTVRVLSGDHDRGFCRGEEPGCCIAEMLLVPGRGMDVDMFVGDLYRAAYDAQVLCSPTVARDLVKRLTASADERIARRAREVIPMLTVPPG